MPKHYVYRLVDPRDDETFYIGKGKGRRAWAHTDEVRNGRSGSNPSKRAVIRELLDMRLEPRVDIVREFETEAEALQLEAEMIKAGGVRLTNLMLVPVKKAVKRPLETLTQRLMAGAERTAKTALSGTLTELCRIVAGVTTYGSPLTKEDRTLAIGQFLFALVGQSVPPAYAEKVIEDIDCLIREEGKAEGLKARYGGHVIAAQAIAA